MPWKLREDKKNTREWKAKEKKVLVWAMIKNSKTITMVTTIKNLKIRFKLMETTIITIIIIKIIIIGLHSMKKIKIKRQVWMLKMKILKDGILFGILTIKMKLRIIIIIIHLMIYMKQQRITIKLINYNSLHNQIILLTF